MRQLLLSDLWPTVSKLSKSAATVQAAIAYVSSPEHLHLHAGDTLITDASESAIKAGQTSARVLQEFFRRGVVVYHCARLHAKLLVVDDRLIVGSGNASGSSANRLLEAAILTTDPTLVAQAQSFLFQVAKQSVALDEKALSTLAKIKVAPRVFSIGGAARKKIVASGKTTWLAMIADATERTFAGESVRVAAAGRVIEKLMPRADPIPVKFWGNLGIKRRVENGDLVCVGWAKCRGETPYRIDPPSAVLYCQKGERSTIVYYDPDLLRPLLPLKWREFQRLLKAAGLPPIKSSSVRSVTPEQAVELQRIWPRATR